MSSLYLLIFVQLETEVCWSPWKQGDSVFDQREQLFSQIWRHEDLDRRQNTKLSDQKRVGILSAIFGKVLLPNFSDRYRRQYIKHLYHKTDNLCIERKQVGPFPCFVQVICYDGIMLHLVIVMGDVSEQTGDCYKTFYTLNLPMFVIS